MEIKGIIELAERVDGEAVFSYDGVFGGLIDNGVPMQKEGYDMEIIKLFLSFPNWTSLLEFFTSMPVGTKVMKVGEREFRAMWMYPVKAGNLHPRF